MTLFGTRQINHPRIIERVAGAQASGRKQDRIEQTLDDELRRWFREEIKPHSAS